MHNQETQFLIFCLERALVNLEELTKLLPYRRQNLNLIKLICKQRKWNQQQFRQILQQVRRRFPTSSAGEETLILPGSPKERPMALADTIQLSEAPAAQPTRQRDQSPAALPRQVTLTYEDATICVPGPPTNMRATDSIVSERTVIVEPSQQATDNSTEELAVDPLGENLSGDSAPAELSKVSGQESSAQLISPENPLEEQPVASSDQASASRDSSSTVGLRASQMPARLQDSATISATIVNPASSAQSPGLEEHDTQAGTPPQAAYTDFDRTMLLPETQVQAQVPPAGASSEAAPDVALSVGEQLFGKYILIERLGAGGMGVVYKAYHPELERYFALKMILPNRCGEENVQRFVREARLAASLKHRNIVGVHDVGLQGGQYYIVMDFIDGKDLGRLMKEEALNPREALRIAFFVAQALHYAHEHNVVHRDIKPQNIIVVGHDHFPYLMDFGLATTIDSQDNLTRSGEILGTPQYMSPEQAQGKVRAIDGRTDIYSLGAVLYEMLGGQPIFKPGNLAGTLYRIVHEEAPPLSKHCPNIARDVEAIVMKCLEKDPARRYRHARALADDIERYLQGHAVQARPCTVFNRMFKWVRRNRAFSGLLAASVVLLISLVGLLLYQHIANYRALASKNREIAAKNQALRQANKFIKQQNRQITAQNRKLKREIAKRHALERINEIRRLAEEGIVTPQIYQEMEALVKAHADQAVLWQEKVHVLWALVKRESKRERRLKWLQQALDAAHQAQRLDAHNYLAWYYAWQIAAALRLREKQTYCLNKIIALAPENELGYWGRGWRYLSQAQQTSNPRQRRQLLRQAVKAFSRSLQLDPRWALTYAHRGLAYTFLGQYQHALEDCNRAIAMEPDYTPNYYIYRGNVFYLTRHWQRALTDFSRAIAMAPRCARAYGQRANTYKALHQASKALPDYNMAIRLAPRDAQIYADRAALYTRLGKFDLALRDIERALHLDAHLTLAYLNRGLIYVRQKKYSQALRDFSSVLQRDPYNKQAFINRANIYIRMQQYSKAQADCQQALKLDSNYWAAYSNLGAVHLFQHNYKAAVQNCTRAMALYPTFAPLYYRRACAYYQLGDHQRARQDLAHALKLGGPSLPLVRQWVIRIQQQLRQQ